MHGFSIPRPQRNYWKDTPRARHHALKHFTPQFFTICMGTGVMAVLMRNNPYGFKGLGTISVIVFVLDLLLFSMISITFLLRWIWFTKTTAKLFESDVEQTTYLSTTTIAAATLVELVSLVCGAKWNHWQHACFALWWVTVSLGLFSATTTYWLLIRDEKVSIENLSPTLMYPVTGLLASATAGSVLVGYTPLSTGLSQPVIIVSYLLLGAGFFLTLLTMSAYFLRLLHNQTPAAKKVAAQLIPLAPLSNAAYCFDSLGYLAGPKRHVFELYSEGPVSKPEVGNALYAAGFILGLIVWGFATFWLIISVVAFVRDIPKTRFNLNMWSGAYPIGIYGVAATQLAISLDSPVFRVVSTVVLIVLVIYWLYLVLWSLPMVISGEFFLSEVLHEMEKEREKRDEGEEGARAGRASASDASTAV